MAAFLLSCLIILLLFPLSCCAQSAAYIVPIGASLTAAQHSNPWRSPSGDFAFGFQQLPDNKDDLFVLSIWFDKIPDKTIVWYENSSYPVARGSTVRLDAAQGIVVQDPQGRTVFTSNSFKGSTRVATGFMNDTGNFVLRGNDSTMVWESFKDPKDTILPTQVIDSNGKLISRVTAANFSLGKYSGKINDQGEFTLTAKSFPLINTIADLDYFSSNTSSTNLSKSDLGYQLVFEESARLSIVRKSGRRVVISSETNPSGAKYYYRATLDFDGIFAQYYHPKNFSGNPGWATAESWPEDICTDLRGNTGSGTCGYNSVCRLETGRPVCQCPKGYSLADPRNAFGDCMPNHAVFCSPADDGGLPENEYELYEIPDTVWPGNNYETVKPSTEEQCRNFCLSDCFCGAVGYDNNQCWKKRLPLTNGRVDTSLGTKTFLKLSKANYNASSGNPEFPTSKMIKRDQGTIILVVSILLGGLVLINCLVIGSSCLGLNRVFGKRFGTPIPAQDTSGPNLCCFTYEELVQATDGFKEELGRGSFGIVYRGVIGNSSKSIVAVKKLDRIFSDSEREFKAEVNMIGQTHHKNLVRLVGFCNEGPQRLLVYEYMSNGTLANFIFTDAKPSWSQRMQIALGVGRGLTYLHDECSTQIIHCDIKPQNILLDEFYNAYISDFGLAKTLMMGQSKTLTNIRGTRGYVAPEWFRNMSITAKVDVYSFGVLLLEIIACRKSVDNSLLPEDETNPILIDWAWDCYMEGRLDSLVGNDTEALNDRKALERNVMVGIWCIQEDASMRPTMRKVCQMLEGVVEVGVPPCPYAYSSTL